jgi:class 3 adenylate cyclase
VDLDPVSEPARIGEDLHARVGELRRLTIMFCDVVGSTELSGRCEPEAYRELMGEYRAACREVIESRFEGHIVQIKGDGILSAFGFPVAHENDAERAVRAGLALVRAVRSLRPRGSTGERLDVRVSVHHGPVYVDIDEDDVYGLTANVGARLQTIAEPGTVVLSEEALRLVEDRFEVEPGTPQSVKGLADPLRPFRVVSHRGVRVPRVWSTPLVERDHELERLRAAWAAASAGTEPRGTGVLLSGEAGVGKSRLVAAFVDETESSGARVVELHGSPLHSDAGFHPVRSLIEHRCGVTEEAGQRLRLERLARELVDLGLESTDTLPLLAALAGIAPSAGYEPVAAEGRRLEEQIERAARDYIVACAGDAPAIIVAENLHWFDEATRALVAAVIQEKLERLLVLGTSRDGGDEPWETIAVRPLSQSGRLELISALQDGLDEADRVLLAERSGGIPLFLEELVRAGDAAAKREDAGPVPGSVPAALYEPLVARLYAIPAALPVAATVAAAGHEVDRSLLSETLPLTSDELDSTLQALLGAEILQRVAGRHDRYHFRHELLREVAYELQPPTWRRRVHSRLCDVLTREEPGDWRVVASHFERAERFVEAAHAYGQTAEAARRRGALVEARAHLARAVDLIQDLPTDQAHTDLEVDLRLRHGFLAMSLEGACSADAADDYAHCLALTEADPHGDAMFGTLNALFAYYLSRAELDHARETATRLRRVLTGPRRSFGPLNLAGFGLLDLFEGRCGSALEILREARAKHAEVGEAGDISPVWFVPHDARAAMEVFLAMARFMSSDVVGADESLACSRAVSEQLEFPQGPWSVDYTYWIGSWMWIESGRFEAASAAVQELQLSSELHGFATWQLIAATQAATLEGIVAAESGSPDTGALAQHASTLGGFIELWKALGLRIFLPFYLTTCGALLAAAGDAAAARERYEDSLQLASETGMRFYDAETARRIADLAPEPESKIAALTSALQLARSQAARPFELRIALDLHELMGEDARSYLELAMAAFTADASTAELDRARALVPAPR